MALFRKLFFLKPPYGLIEISEGVYAIQYCGSLLGRNVDALILYFGKDPSHYTFDQVMSTLRNVVKMFSHAHNENCKQLELEKKKAEKEAEREKQKPLAPQKISENMLQSQIKSLK